MSRLLELEILKANGIARASTVVPINDVKVAYFNGAHVVIYDLVLKTQRIVPLEPGEVVCAIGSSSGSTDEFLIGLVLQSPFPNLLVLEEENSRPARSQFKCPEHPGFEIVHFTFTFNGEHIPTVVRSRESGQDEIIIISRKRKERCVVLLPQLGMEGSLGGINVTFLNFCSFSVFSSSLAVLVSLDRCFNLEVEWSYEQEGLLAFGVCRNSDLFVAVTSTTAKCFKSRFLSTEHVSLLPLPHRPTAVSFTSEYVVLGYEAPRFSLLSKDQRGRPQLVSYDFHCHDFLRCLRINLCDSGEIILIEVATQIKKSNVTTVRTPKLISIFPDERAAQGTAYSDSLEPLLEGRVFASCLKKILQNQSNLTIDIIDELFSFELHQGAIRGLALMRWTERVITVAGDHSLRFFTLDRAMRGKFSVFLNEEPLGVAAHPTVPMLAVRFLDSFRIYFMLEQSVTQLYSEQCKRCCELAFSEYGSLLAVAGSQLTLYDPYRVERKYQLMLSAQQRVRGMRFCNSDHELIVFFRSNVVVVYYYQEGFEKKLEMVASPRASLVAYSGELDVLAVFEGSEIVLSYGSSSSEFGRIMVYEDEPTCFFPVKELGIYIIGTRLGFLQVYNAVQLRQEARLRVAEQAVEQLAISEELNKVVVMGRDRMLVMVGISMLKEGDLFVSDQLYHNYRDFMDNKLFYPLESLTLASRLAERENSAKLTILREEKENCEFETKEELERHKRALLQREKASRVLLEQRLEEDSKFFSDQVLQGKERKNRLRESMRQYLQLSKQEFSTFSLKANHTLQLLYKEHFDLSQENASKNDSLKVLEEEQSRREEERLEELLEQAREARKKQSLQVKFLEEELRSELQEYHSGQLEGVERRLGEEVEAGQKFRLAKLRSRGEIRIIVERIESMGKVLGELGQNLGQVKRQKDEFFVLRRSILHTLVKEDAKIEHKDKIANELQANNLKLSEKITYLTQYANLLETEPVPSLDLLDREFKEKEQNLVGLLRRGSELALSLDSHRALVAQWKQKVEAMKFRKICKTNQVEQVKASIARVLAEVNEDNRQQLVEGLLGQLSKTRLPQESSKLYSRQRSTLQEKEHIEQSLEKLVSRDRFHYLVDVKKNQRVLLENESLIKTVSELRFLNNDLQAAAQKLDGLILELEDQPQLKPRASKLSKQMLPFERYKLQSQSRHPKSSSLSESTVEEPAKESKSQLMRTTSYLHKGQQPAELRIAKKRIEKGRTQPRFALGE